MLRVGRVGGDGDRGTDVVLSGSSHLSFNMPFFFFFSSLLCSLLFFFLGSTFTFRVVSC